MFLTLYKIFFLALSFIHTTEKGKEREGAEERCDNSPAYLSSVFISTHPKPHLALNIPVYPDVYSTSSDVRK